MVIWNRPLIIKFGPILALLFPFSFVSPFSLLSICPLLFCWHLRGGGFLVAKSTVTVTEVCFTEAPLTRPHQPQHKIRSLNLSKTYHWDHSQLKRAAREWAGGWWAQTGKGSLETRFGKSWNGQNGASLWRNNCRGVVAPLNGFPPFDHCRLLEII